MLKMNHLRLWIITSQAEFESYFENLGKYVIFKPPANVHDAVTI